MNQHLQTRPATDADAARLCTFLNACTLAHQGIARFSPDDARARLHQSGADPASDSLLACDADEIVGFAQLWRDGTDEIKFFARTLPEQQGRGIGGLLAEWCDARADELLPAGRWTTTTWAADLAASSLLRSRGYRDVRHYLRMEIDSDAVAAGEPSWPEGIEVARLSERDDLARSLYGAWLAAFAGEWGSRAESEQEFWRERRDERDESAFDPALWILACADGEVVGFCLCELATNDEELRGRVAEVGVVPSHRGVGLGSALLRSGFHALQRRDVRRIVLDVDAENVTTAVRLYTSAGMAPHPAFTIWEKERGVAVR